MAGIYLHIPFCKRKCHYCNFFSSASGQHINGYVNALLQELRQERPYLEGHQVETIYFGGGTPSLLPLPEIQRVIESIARQYPVMERPEITLEANPDDLTPDFIRGLSRTAINRLSIGVQSFFDEDLQALNRVHSSAQILTALSDLQSSQFTALSVDLIYGIPGLTDDRWIRNLETAVRFGIPHISAYALTVEEKTALAWLIEKNRMAAVDEEQVARQYRMLVRVLKDAGYVHYEISNFCKPGMESRHNMAYWAGIPYLGVGPSAHSFDGSSRRWNHSNISKYIFDINASGNPAREEESLSMVQQYNEYVMTGLRTMWGCSPGYIKDHFGENFADYFSQKMNDYLAAGSTSGIPAWVIGSDGTFRLTDEGMLFADGIIANLFK